MGERHSAGRAALGRRWEVSGRPAARGSARPVASALALAPVLLALLACGAAAQDPPLDRGLESLRTGQYDDAVRQLEPATRSGPPTARIAAARALAEAHAATGGYDRALAALDAAESAGVPAAELAATRGGLLHSTGRDDDALAAFTRAIDASASDAVTARLRRALVWWQRGDRERATPELERFIELYNRGGARTAAALTAVGTALRYLGIREPELFHDAVRAYDEALAAEPDALEPRVRMAELFLDRYDGGQAQELFGEVLAVNPRHPDALLGMARAKRFEGSPEAIELAERALAVNPSHAPAHAFLGLLRLELGEAEEAEAAARVALTTNPRSTAAHAVLGGAHFLANERSAFDVTRRRALELAPLDAGFDLTVAELAVRRGRYHEAVELAERAVSVDSLAWAAWSLLGMNQLRLGRAEAARRSLERAFEGDPFNVWTLNTLDLMDRVASFETRRTARFELVLDPDEADLLELYMAGVVEDAYDQLAERYGHRPDTPVRVEVYPRHADFSVRTMGLTGLGALGVAFGNVLAINSPAARERGTFHWGSTLWHEIAHAVTLGLTRHRIPRWLTEGISVHEERRSRPGWGGGVGLDFLRAFEEGRLLPMSRIDEGFIRPTYPGQVGVSYQHASLVVERVEREHGAAAVRRLLDGYADGQGTEEVFARVLGVGPDAFDAALARDIRERFALDLAAVRGLLRAGDPGEDGAVPGAAGRGRAAGAAGSGVAELVRRAMVERDDFGAQLAAGRALLRDDRGGEAEPFLERARDLFPSFAQPGSPYELLAAVRLERGDTAGAVEALERLTSLSETAYEANLELAELLEATGERERAAAALERAIYIHPYDPAVHHRLARLGESLGRPALEVRERRAVLALRPVDRAEAFYRLALAYRRAGQRDEARRSVMGALEVAPAYADAQDLLLELSGQ